MLPEIHYRVLGQFIQYDLNSITLFGVEHVQVTDLNDGLAFLDKIEAELTRKLLANRSVINHILMPARSFVLLNNAGCLSNERVSRFCNEFVETLTIPDVGFRQFHVISLPISLAPVTMMVYVIEDELFNQARSPQEDFYFAPTLHLFR